MKKLPSEDRWLEVASATYGIPVQVRDAEGAVVIAIRDPYVQWFDENRASALASTPTGWQALDQA